MQQDQTVFSLLRKLAVSFRYTDVTELIGREITINSVETAESDVRNTLGDVLDGTEYARIMPQNLYVLSQVLRRYGFIDMRFESTTSFELPSAERGVALLRNLGLDTLKRDDIAELNRIAGMEPFFLEILERTVAQISQGHTYLLLYVDSKQKYSEDKMQHFSSTRDGSWIFALPQDYFPRVFHVRKAAMANAECFWYPRFYIII